MNLLVETLRIVNNNLPLCCGEYDESILKEGLVVKEEMRTSINATSVVHSIVELYSSTRAEVVDMFAHNIASYSNLVMMIDFWTCKTTHQNFLGLRVYFVNEARKPPSILLGTRKINPSYGDGIQGPFRAWVDHILEDFNLKTADRKSVV